MSQNEYGVGDSAVLLLIQDQINKAVHNGRSRLTVAENLTRACLEFPCLDCVWLWTYQPGSGQMKLEGAAGADASLLKILDAYPDSSALATLLVVGHEVLDGWDDAWGESASDLRDQGFNQVGVLPLNSENSLIGAIGFATRCSDSFDPRLLSTLRHTVRYYGVRLEVFGLEDRLEAASENMRQILLTRNDPLFIVDKKGIIFRTTLAQNENNLQGNNVDSVLPGGTRILQQYRDHLPAHAVVGSTSLKQSRLIGDNGHLIPVQVTIKKGFWHGQEAFFMSCRDITQQLVIEKERDRLVTAIEQTADSIVITNSSGSIQYTNPAFSKMTGYSAEEALGANPRILKSSRHDHEFYRQMWSTIRRGDIWQGRMVNRKKTGEEYWEVATISPVRDTSGIITHYVGVKHDITNELQLEERFRQSQKLEAIGTLAGGIAHDFNNILYALLGNSQLALDDIPESHPAHLPLTEIVKAGDRGSALVAKMLAFGQRSEAPKKVCQLGPVITEVMELTRASLPTTIEIRMDLEEDCSPMLLDETQIHQVVLNLCTNAAHAMSEGGGVLSLELKQVSVKESTPEELRGITSGEYLRLIVRDTGCGMDSAVVERIFEPYFTTKKPNEGTGLGLASAHGIVSNHDGRILVDSTPGQGTVFTMFFPVAKENVRPVVVDPAEHQDLVGQGRVMVVDDEQMIIDVVVRGLRKKGFQVMGFVDGIEALEVFRKDPDAFDFVITDQTMPNITGFELASHLSSIRPDLPIILSTGYANTVNESELRTAGVSHFLSKPLKIKQLVALLCEISEQSPALKGV